MNNFTSSNTSSSNGSGSYGDSVHARAFNLARRYSERNENDLLQESFMDDPEEDGSNYGHKKSKNNNFTAPYCESLLQQHVPEGYEMPTECMRFSSFRQGLIRRDSRREDENIAFAGMDAHAQLKAISAREHHHASPAQIKRRLTSQSPKEISASSWF
mmetsp:Transcript_13240/g.32297  ORF Transcript_13240/g.32297 Transcript_13240/m.32297 type:complete len:158 (-) Transcript_13240:2504-2977(-)|eukprot:CAMPEP_0113472628 /NCGR_PEP_ID=MMETSP0014_2-20120614/17615_1 /TAXON_ID=2857 /ORGANISM="Nitzschia sp." /LENGTH=157 /DNA_ID=CAMNT_0000365347 /DNA_START=444 /DNA_END=917 /DNA_ORIENTATION=+ /assembly_acc=CAM_ASM_000159